MIKSLVFIILVYLGGLLGAQVWGAEADADKMLNGEPKSDTEAQLLAEIFPSHCHFSGRFRQKKNIDGIAFPLRSNGDFFFSCELGLIWHTIAPFKEALLYANARINYRVAERGEIEPLTGMARYAISKIFIRLLNGDTDYFAEEFEVKLTTDGSSTDLIPESEYMKKGIERIRIKKSSSMEAGIHLNINIKGTTGQDIEVTIDKMTEHTIADKIAAYEQCKVLYPSPLKWCRVLRSPGYYLR